MWNIIDSVKHNNLQLIKHLKNTSFTNIILEEWQHIKWLLECKNPIYKIEYIISSEENYLNELYNNYKIPKKDLFFTKQSILKSVTTNNRIYIIAYVTIHQLSEFTTNKTNYLNNITMVLNNVKDYGNIGTIIRNSYMLGVYNFIIINEFNCYYKKIIDASRGLIFSCNLYLFKNSLEAKEFLSLNEFFLIITSIYGDNNLKIEDKDKKLAIVLSNEITGADNCFTQLPHLNFKIPMYSNPQCDSLNVGVTAGIILYKLIYM